MTDEWTTENVVDKLIDAAAGETYATPAIEAKVRSQFNAWLARHDAQVKAETLRPILDQHAPVDGWQRTPTGVRIRWASCSCGCPAYSACPARRFAEDILNAVRKEQK